MFRLTDLRVPLVAAPMAGGPSTPALVAAAARAGALGFLAAGYLTAEQTAAQIEQARRLCPQGAAFGLNIFDPSATDADPRALDAYAARLAPLARQLGVAVGEPHPDDDAFDAKVGCAIEAGVPVVSFTFGLPPAETVAALHAADVAVWASVASVADALRAALLGVDAVVLQGVHAGGHRATLTADAEPNETSALDLVRGVQLDIPVVAAGGVSVGRQIATLMSAGASAVAVGTALLLTPEAGTSPTHRAALTSPEFRLTGVTRAFTGRPARGLVNAWMREHLDAPACYPDVHQLTAPLRKAASAAGDAQHTHLWAGVGWRSASAASATDVLVGLWRDALASAQTAGQAPA